MEPYRRPLLRLAVLCNVIGAVLLFFFILSLQGPREPRNRTHSLRAWIAQRLAPPVAPPAPVAGTQVYGPFLPPGLNPPASAPAPPPAERPAPAPTPVGSLLPGLRLPQVFPLVPRQLAPLPGGSCSAGSGVVPVREKPPSLQVTLPAHLFADSQQASEVALLLGDQLSRQGYLATVVVTDQEESPSITAPSEVAEAPAVGELPALPIADSGGLPAGFSSRAHPPLTEGSEPGSAGETPRPAPREGAGGSGPEMALVAPTGFPTVPSREPEKSSPARMAAPAQPRLAELASPSPVADKSVGEGPARLAKAPRAVQVTLPAHHFSDSARMAEVVTSLGQQLARQGYVTTVEVTDQARFASAPPVRSLHLPKAAGPVPAWSEPAGPSVRIAQGGPNAAAERRWEPPARFQEPRAVMPSPALGAGESREIRSVAWAPSWPRASRFSFSPKPSLERPKAAPAGRNPSSQEEGASEEGEPLRIAAREIPAGLPISRARPQAGSGRMAPGGAEPVASPSPVGRSPKLEGQVIQVAQALSGNDPFPPRPHLTKGAPPEPVALYAGMLASGERETSSDQGAVKLAALRLVRAWRQTGAPQASPPPGSPLPSRTMTLESVAPPAALRASPDVPGRESGPEKRSVRIAAAAGGSSSETEPRVEGKPAMDAAGPAPGLLAGTLRLAQGSEILPPLTLPSAASPVESAGKRSLPESDPGVLSQQAPLTLQSAGPSSQASVQVARAPVRRIPSVDAPADSRLGTAAVAAAPAEPPSPPVRIAWAPGNPGMPQPPSGLPWEIPRDAPPPVWGSWLEAGDHIASASQQAVRAAATRLVEGWRRLRAGGEPPVPPVAVSSSDRRRAGSDALLAAPAGVLLPLFPVLERTSQKSKRSPLPATEGQVGNSPAVYRVIPAFEVQLVPFQSREEARQHLLRLQGRGFPVHLRDLSALGQPKAIVWVGPYPEAAAAEACRNVLAAQGYRATVQATLSFLPAGQETRERYAVQVVCLQDGSQAQRVAEGLAADGLPVLQAQDPSSALWRVYVGPLTSREVAQQVAQHLSLAGCPTWVVGLD